ncbi:hypothetical protein PRIPAC_73508 [Pristionchus pacificus]|uniref:Uncharacterized protein n=1 Tax=Pristionchus pacificus TaxID=54126 RepID=A0A2A6C8T0_PRIPA|nr:hypothetical protein PRIPAC_73508 [Pristionchus pacificus]|eukprot:PDM74488.1 hypothetical protein PRIPAC_41844 [Pristionchus pacificus]
MAFELIFLIFSAFFSLLVLAISACAISCKSTVLLRIFRVFAVTYLVYLVEHRFLVHGILFVSEKTVTIPLHVGLSIHAVISVALLAIALYKERVMHTSFKGDTKAPKEDVEPVQLRSFAYPKEDTTVRNDDRIEEKSMTNSDSEISDRASGDQRDSTVDETDVRDHEDIYDHSLYAVEKK